MSISSISGIFGAASAAPLIVNIDTNVILWATYSPTGAISVSYSTNLFTSPVEWLSVTSYLFTAFPGTNLVFFAPPATNNTVFFRLQQSDATNASPFEIDVDLDIDGVAENLEGETQGGFVCYNGDNDDDAVPSGTNTVMGDNLIDADLSDRICQEVSLDNGVTNYIVDDELVRMDLSVVPLSIPDAIVKLVATSGADKIRIWPTSHKSTGPSEDDPVIGVPLSGSAILEKEWGSPSSVPAELWIEGLDCGTATLELICESEFGLLDKDEIKITIIKLNATAHRPTTEGPLYGMPLLQKILPESEEENPGAGIRVNGDTEASADENDLIEIELRAEPYPTPAGLTYALRRTNANVTIWDSQDRSTALLATGVLATVTLNAETRTVWVEHTGGGESDFEFVARTGGGDICFDRIHFYPFTCVVIALGGEDQVPSDPADPNHGIYQLAVELYESGYDVHLYDEDNVANNGAGPVFDEVVNAIVNRNVTNVAIYGYSHGAGSTHDLAERLDNNRGQIGSFSIPFTAYMDGVQNDSDIDIDQERRRPPSTGYHVNYYQQGTFADFFLDGGPIFDPPGADQEDNVDDPVVTHTHFTVDDDAVLLNDIGTRFIERVTR